MYVNCKIHHEKMNEYLDDKEIIPYCLSCVVDHRLNLYYPSKLSFKKKVTAIIQAIGSNIILIAMTLILACIATITTSILFTTITDTIIEYFNYNAPNKDMYYVLIYLMILIIYIVISVLYIVRKKKHKLKMTEKIIRLEKEKLQIHIFNYQNKVEQFKKELKKSYELSNVKLKDVLRYDDQKLGEFIKLFFEKREYVFFKDYHQKDTFINFVLKQNEEKIGVQYRERNTTISDDFIQDIQRNQQALKCQQMIIITNLFFTEKRFNDCKNKNIHLWNKDIFLNEILKETENYISWKEYLRNCYNFEKINQIPNEKWL